MRTLRFAGLLRTGSLVRVGPVASAALLLLLAGPTAPLSAQDESGQVAGRVMNVQSGRPVVSARVAIEGTSVSVTDLDGRYLLSGVPAGAHTVQVQMMGFGSKSITDVVVEAGETVTLDITVEERAMELDAITVTAERERGSASFLLDQRRTASSLVESVGSSEIARRPDSDAAEVAMRLTGVTVTEGKYVFVRGMGDRYSQTSLNGSSLPSPEPEREVVPLDLFPAGFLESLETQKSYTPDLPADFSGGSVRINTKDFPTRFTVKFGTSTSFNTNSQFQNGFLRYGSGGRDWLGFDDGSRGQPAALEEFLGGVRSGERLPDDPDRLVQIGEGLRDAEHRWAPGSTTTPLNRSFNLSLGGSTPVFDDGELGFILAGTYSDNYQLRSCDARTTALSTASSDATQEDCQEFERKWTTSAFKPETAEIATPNVDYGFTRGMRTVSWGAIGNFTLELSPTQKISLRTTTTLNTDDEARFYQGDNGEDIGGEIYSERSRYLERLLLWSQLSGEHQTVFDSRLDWRVSGARADRSEPFMRETIYLRDPVGGDFFLLDFTESARYFFSELIEDDLSAAVDWQLPFDFLAGEARLKLGGSYRSRQRDFGARRLNWRFLGGTVSDLDQALATGSVLGTPPRNANEFQIDDVIEPGDVYQARDDRGGAYVMLDLPVTDRLRAIIGTRVEDYGLELTSRGEILSRVDQVDLAPALNLIYSVRDDISLRGAVSRTVDRPEFRELAPFQFTEATSLRQLFGNPDLEPAEITSADLRADWFFGLGELVSIGGFFKKINDPIEQVFIAAASSAYSFQNAESATLVGAEFEVRLQAGRLADPLRDLYFHGNYSWIDSEVRVIGEGSFQPTNTRRPLEGQAPHVLNLGLNYVSPVGLEAGLFYNRFGARVEAAGGSGVPDIYEQPRNSLDATLAFPVVRNVRAKVKATNLFDAPFQFEQSANGFVRTQRAYSVGRTLSVDLSWEF